MKYWTKLLSLAETLLDLYMWIKILHFRQEQECLAIQTVHGGWFAHLNSPSFGIGGRLVLFSAVGSQSVGSQNQTRATQSRFKRIMPQLLLDTHVSLPFSSPLHPSHNP